MGERGSTGRNIARATLGVLTILCLAAPAHASVEISADATENMSCSGGVCSPTDKKAVLNVNDLTTMLAAGDVKVTTGAGAITITVSAPFSWTSTSRLTLDAIQNVSLKAPVTVAGTGAVTITTNDGGSGGELRFFPGATLDFWDTSSSLVINGSSYTLVKDITTLSTNISANPSGSYALANDYDAAADGTYHTLPIPTLFAGTFVGLNHAIADLRVVIYHTYHVPGIGLFSECLATCRLSYLRVLNADIDVRESKRKVGILAGINLGVVTNSMSSGLVEGGDVPRGKTLFASVGGLVGENRSGGLVSRSSSSADVDAFGRISHGGGLIGTNKGSIEESFATGAVTVSDAWDVYTMAGGLAGENDGLVVHAYATGSARGDSHSAVAAVLGWAAPASGVDQAYGIGAVAGGAFKGGFVGYDKGNTTFSSALWDLNTTGVSDPSQGAGNVPNDPGLTGLTDDQLKSGLPTGFDPAIWGQLPSINNGYPYLLANPPPQ